MRILLLSFFISLSSISFSQSPNHSFLGSDTLVCDSTGIQLKAPSGYRYLWSTDDTTQAIKGYESRIYWVKITDPDGNSYTDTIDVTIKNEKSNRANHWYFGKGGAIKFDSTTYESSADNTTLTYDFPAAASAISRGDGSVLFYTNGSSIYDRNHEVMEKGIKGDTLVPQSTLLIAEPQSHRYFYQFSVKDDSLFYTQIDLFGNAGGKGKVIQKNVFLYKSVDANLTAAKSGDEIWLIGHIKNSAQFFSIKITSEGPPFETPVVSTSGPVAGSPLNFLKADSEGTKLVMTGETSTIYSFDPETGRVSEPVTVTVPGAFGAEFSEDGLFVTTLDYTYTDPQTKKPGGSLFKIDPSTGKITDTLLTNDTLVAKLGALQIGPDKKIYLAKEEGCLGIIEGDTINYNGICMNNRSSYSSLPNFPPYYFKPPQSPGFSGNSVCLGQSITFTGSNPWEGKDYITVTYVYNFGDGSPTIRSKDAQHRYSQPGVYTVTCTITANSCKSETITQEVSVIPYPDLSHIRPTYSFCAGESVMVNAENHQSSILWSTGSTDHELSINTQGNYSVSASNDICTVSRNFTVAEKQKPVVNLGNDITTCTGSQVTVTAGIENVSYQWNTGSTSKTINPTVSGTYRVIVSDGQCSGEDEIKVEFLPYPIKAAFPNTVISCNETVQLDAANPGFRYKWSTGDTTQIINVLKSGIYSVEVYLNSCKNNFSSDVKINKINFQITGDTIFCEQENEPLILDAGKGSEFLWSTGETSQKIAVHTRGEYFVKKTNENNCIISDRIIIVSDCKPGILIPDAFTPNNDGDNDVFKPITSRVTSYEFRVFNRWGQQIFYTTDVTKGWDGTYFSEPVLPGVYIYTIDYSGEGVEKKSLEGQITLFR